MDYSEVIERAATDEKLKLSLAHQLSETEKTRQILQEKGYLCVGEPLLKLAEKLPPVWE